ncbi:excinuclease ABC subunit UvrA [Nitrospira moscoviensis]|uniref:UvrABC system protein A n=1 Tax=Nitrospira moscoviensis TaxID=42253 RepID=A0A0K2GG96_NITMO|nr:excinuclease ABC subunit UvrA [Nitrospira moscoviensis]ALA59975.1 UvrABC system protein A [Nitrospira moscoviensis]
MALTPPSPDSSHHLVVEGARQHNLKNISLRIPHDRVTAITGLSGSGKSSLAFDTIFAEGQWRYVESLSTYARMFLDKVARPDVERILNVRPAIAIEQKNQVRTARSTVGTTTEIADLLRLLFAKIGKPVCPDCRQEARSYHPEAVTDDLLKRLLGARAMILFPVAAPNATQTPAFTQTLLTRGFTRLKVGDQIIDLHDLSPRCPLPIVGEGKGEGARLLYVVLDRLIIRADDRARLVEAVETAFREGEGTCVVDVIGHGPQSYSTRYLCQGCGRRFEPLRPVLFSFNHPLGACPECKGFGNVLRYDPDLVIPDEGKSLSQGAIEPWSKPGTDWWQKQMLLAMKRRGVDLTVPFKDLPKATQQLLWQGDRSFDGINDFFMYMEGKRYKLHVRVLLSRYRTPFDCPGCHGSRLKPEALFVRIAGTDIHRAMGLTVEGLREWVEFLPLRPFEQEIAADILRQLTAKLGFLLRVGLGYLTLDRQTKTLSGGEAQRVALANQLGSRLVGTLYVLDEPTIGLHARDTDLLAGILKDLAAVGNTVVVVEHDRRMIESADYVVEMGPRSGEHGGQVVCAAPTPAFIADSRAITARYLRGEDTIPLPKIRRSGSGKFLVIAGAAEHNLKDLLIRIPLGMLICVTGVSGSGKSTLVEDTLYRAVARAFRVESLPMGRFKAIKGLEHLKGIRLIDQQPIGRTPRSNPITYLKAFDEIRQLFAAELDALKRGFTPGHFSFNATGGRCERCEGSGVEKLEMYFFEDIYAPCEVCEGKRFKPEVLQIRYRGKNISDVLNMTVDGALAFFAGAPKLQERLHLLSSIGLGYLRLGQSATTLSGGEAQRLKIAAELISGGGLSHQGTVPLPGRTNGDRHRPSRSQSPRDVLYIMDEPTTGLHFEDIKKLLAVLNKLVNAGNTLVIVEHNLDVIKCADWIIDLGPEGGAAGGQIVAEGRPEQVAKVAASHTGRFLAKALAG